MIRALLVIIVVALSACTSQEQADFNLAKKSIDQGHYRIALGYLDRVIKRDLSKDLKLESAREAARISLFEIKDFNKAIKYYQYLVLNSPDEQERIFAQKQIADIYFDNLQDYQKSIIEISKLQQMSLPDHEIAQYKMSVARAQYYLNNFFQSESELESLLRLKADPNIIFSALLLRGNILVAKKKYEQAIVIFNKLMKEYPEKSREENVGLTLAVCYEEELNFASAIAVLKTLHETYKPQEYIDLRIKRVEARRKNAPGAKGFRK